MIKTASCLPRASGGVSSSRSLWCCKSRSSPRKRGCFQGKRRDDGVPLVFPAQAGVFLSPCLPPWEPRRLPRASGGVSSAAVACHVNSASSPRKRGCFSPGPLRESAHGVFPAQAGVFPPSAKAQRKKSGLPRASGGVSEDALIIRDGIKSSPRKRGCFRFGPQSSNHPCGLPRVSGGVS